MTKRAKPGDIFEVVCGDGVFYIQFVGRHPIHGDTIRVRPEVTAMGRDFDFSTFRDSSTYITFYPLNAAIREGLVRRVGNVDPGEMPRRLRSAGARRGTEVLTWIILSDGPNELRKVLSKDERALPIAAIWNHEFLLSRVREGWRPEKEG